MTYGRNPNGVPLGSVGHTEVPLPGSGVRVVKLPAVSQKSSVADAENTSDYGSEDPNYVDNGVEESSGGGIWQGLVGTPAQPGEEEIDLVEGDPSEDDVIYGTDDSVDNGDDVIYGDPDFGTGEMSNEEWDKIIEGDDDEMDAIIEGKDEEGMSDEEMNDIIYGEPDKPEPPKIKKSVYRVSKPRNIPQQRPTNTGMGMMQ